MTCSYHRRWWVFAQSVLTSPRMMEVKPPRTMAVPMYTWMMKPPMVAIAATTCTVTARITQPVKTPRNGFHEPQSQAGNHQQDDAVKHEPEEHFLAVVEAALGGQLFDPHFLCNASRLSTSAGPRRWFAYRRATFCTSRTSKARSLGQARDARSAPSGRRRPSAASQYI